MVRGEAALTIIIDKKKNPLEPRVGVIMALG